MDGFISFMADATPGIGIAQAASPLAAWFPLVAIGAGILTFVLFQRSFARDRARRWAVAAADKGWTLQDPAGRSLDSLHERFDLQTRSIEPTITHVVVGQKAGCDFRLFEYSFADVARDGALARSNAILIRVGDLGTGFRLRPKPLHRRLRLVPWSKDMTFDTHPVFSDRYSLQSEDDAAIRQLFDASILDFFERRYDVSAELQGELLLFYRLREQVAPENVDGFVDEGVELANLLRRQA